MQAVHMKYRPKYKRRAQNDTSPSIIGQGSFVHLSPVNQYSISPCPKQSDTAVAYSKGKLSAIPRVSWDDEEKE